MSKIRILSVATAWLFALFANQGVVYYAFRFSVGASFQSPWPILIAMLTSMGALLVATEIHPYLRRLLLFFGAITLFYCSTSLWSESLFYGPQKIQLTLLIPPVCIVAGYVVTRDGQLQQFLFGCALLGAFTAAVFVMNGHTAELFAEDERTRAVIITYHNFAFVMALGAISALHILVAVRALWVRLAAVAAFLAFNYFVLTSGGRIGILIVLFALFTMVLGLSRRAFTAWIAMGSLVVIAGFGLLTVRGYAFDIWSNPELPATLRRIVYYGFIQGAGNATTETRDVYYELAKEVFLRAPVLGVGWGGFPVSAGLPDQSGQWPHNLVLELLSETGLLGLSLFVLFLGFVVRDFLLHAGRADERVSVLVIFTAGFAASMVGSDWTGQRLLFFGIGAMAGFAARFERSSRLSSAASSPLGAVPAFTAVRSVERYL